MTKLIHLQMFWQKSRQSGPKSITNHQRNFQVLMTQLFKPMSNLASLKIENVFIPRVNNYNLKHFQRFATKRNRGSNSRGEGSRSPLMGYISHLKCCLKSVFEKKLQIFLCGAFIHVLLTNCLLKWLYSKKSCLPRIMHCVKSVQIGSFFVVHIFLYSD